MGSAHAETWNRAGFSENWSNLLNWQGLQRPVSGATTLTTFAGGARLPPVQDLGLPFALNSLTIAPNAGAFSLRGNTLRFDGSDARLVQNSSSASILNEVQLATNLAFDGPGTITPGGYQSRAPGLSRNTPMLSKRGTGTLILAPTATPPPWIEGHPRDVYCICQTVARVVNQTLSPRVRILVVCSEFIQGQGAVISACAPDAQDMTNRRYRRKGVIDGAERAENKTKSSVRAKVEHPFLVIKRIFGFAKTRYKGLEKNAHPLFVTCALANPYLVRRRLLRSA